MQTIFDRIHTQFTRLKEKYESDVDLSFNDGASDEDFKRLEEVLGFGLPDAFKAVYHIHNGSDNAGNFIDENWLTIDGIISEYTVWKTLYEEGCFDEDGVDIGCEPDDGIQSNFWFNPKWIPLTANGCGDGKMMDLDPTSDGTVGQIIQMWHDDPSRTLEAVSLMAFFEKFAQDLENDQYVIHPNYHGVVLADDLSDDEYRQIDD